MSGNASSMDDDVEKHISLAYSTFDANLRNAVMMGPSHSSSPGPSRLCPMFLLGSFSLIMDGPLDGYRDPELWPERRNEAIVWALRWATHPRTELQMLDLIKQECNCGNLSSASQSFSFIHHWGRVFLEKDDSHRRNFSSSTTAVHFLARCFEAFVRFRDHHARHLRGSFPLHQLSQRDRWPRSLEDMLPHGTDATLRSLEGWLIITQLPSSLRARLFTCLNVILAISHTFTVPFVLQWPNLPSVLTMKGKETRQNLIENRGRNHVGSNIVNNTIGQLDGIGFVFQQLRLYSLRSVRHHYLRPSVLALLHCCVVGYQESMHLLHLIMNGHIANTHEESQQLCEQTADYFLSFGGDLLDTSPDLKKHPDIQQLTTEPFISARISSESCSQSLNENQRLLMILKFLAHEQRCMHVDCSRTSADRDCQVRICSGCRRIQYCSGRCQKLAWVHPLIPHRNHCAALAIVCADLDLQSRRELKSANRVRRIKERIFTPPIERLLPFVADQLDSLGQLCNNNVLSSQQ